MENRRPDTGIVHKVRLAGLDTPRALAGEPSAQDRRRVHANGRNRPRREDVPRCRGEPRHGRCRVKVEVWVVLDEKEARFLKTGGSIATTAEGGQHVRISYFPTDEPDQ